MSIKDRLRTAISRDTDTPWPDKVLADALSCIEYLEAVLIFGQSDEDSAEEGYAIRYECNGKAIGSRVSKVPTIGDTMVNGNDFYTVINVIKYDRIEFAIVEMEEQN